jgi:hypothetical protein
MWPLSENAWLKFSRAMPTLLLATLFGAAPMLGLDAFGLLERHQWAQDVLVVPACICVGGYALAGIVALTGWPQLLVPRNLRNL